MLTAVHGNEHTACPLQFPLLLDLERPSLPFFIGLVPFTQVASQLTTSLSVVSRIHALCRAGLGLLWQASTCASTDAVFPMAAGGQE